MQKKNKFNAPTGFKNTYKMEGVIRHIISKAALEGVTVGGSIQSGWML